MYPREPTRPHFGPSERGNNVNKFPSKIYLQRARITNDIVQAPACTRRMVISPRDLTSSWGLGDLNATIRVMKKYVRANCYSWTVYQISILEILA